MMEKLNQIEKTAMDVIRGAGKYGVYLSQLGFEVAGVADWLECQVPRIRGAFSAIARAAEAELARPDTTKRDQQEN
jgi:hypothetical protein